MALYEIKNIVANPFRHIKRYPIKREKVAALRESLQKTGFWDNVVARARDGKAEIAYGHHRLAALKEEYGPNHQVELIIRKLGDELMIQIMARENMEEWGTNAAVEQETIRAVVEAYGAGLIRLPIIIRPDPKVVRYAPSFVRGKFPTSGPRPEVAYTAQSIAEFIGWVGPSGDAQTKVREALTALQFIEEGVLKESDFEGLTTKQAEAVTEQARLAKKRRDVSAEIHRRQAEEAKKQAEDAARWREEAKEKQRKLELEAKQANDAKARERATKEAAKYEQQQMEADEKRKLALRREQSSRKEEQLLKAEGLRSAAKVGRAVSVSLKKGEIGFGGAREVRLRVDSTNGDGEKPDIESFAEELSGDLSKILHPKYDKRAVKLNELIRYRADLLEPTRINLARVLESLSKRALDYNNQLSGKAATQGRALLLKRG
jgi:flagellar biosynthesis GTPase FlhF